MDIKKVILELLQNKIIHTKPTQYEPLIGGTVSQLYLLNSDGIKYVVKINTPEVIQSEAAFLHYYKETTLLPKLLFMEPSYKYIVYSFINGSTDYGRKNKKEILKALVQGLLNHYKPIPDVVGWGWADQPADSWENFLINEILEAKKWIDSRLGRDDHDFVITLVKKIRLEIKPYLIHGDCGVHNFIFHEQQLCGVIDPAPVIGEPLYDLIYAFCSSPDDLTKETFDYAVSHLMIEGEKEKSFLYEKVVIGLYLRLGTCIKHHSSDFGEYLKAWDYWVNVIKKGS
ncbi:aminoglycoside phosphotransferase family protein [Mesobacillus foraminis]|uniref:Phosphotransferase family enzyme n=1 Tax=Mesobacillus foraminis TaxID=279826 RepID=A0A4R2B264_9BACI|nr:aminoglycoside phosphotransferase family protein [Mesobacillus foraminis]TCN20521.1 phosphotransferase family enzyme [Mesobacillus foraminis]